MMKMGELGTLTAGAARRSRFPLPLPGAPRPRGSVSGAPFPSPGWRGRGSRSSRGDGSPRQAQGGSPPLPLPPTPQDRARRPHLGPTSAGWPSRPPCAPGLTPRPTEIRRRGFVPPPSWVNRARRPPPQRSSPPLRPPGVGAPFVLPEGGRTMARRSRTLSEPCVHLGGGRCAGSARGRGRAGGGGAGMWGRGPPGRPPRGEKTRPHPPRPARSLDLAGGRGFLGVQLGTHLVRDLRSESVKRGRQLEARPGFMSFIRCPIMENKL